MPWGFSSVNGHCCCLILSAALKIVGEFGPIESLACFHIKNPIFTWLLNWDFFLAIHFVVLVCFRETNDCLGQKQTAVSAYHYCYSMCVVGGEICAQGTRFTDGYRATSCCYWQRSVLELLILNKYGWRINVCMTKQVVVFLQAKKAGVGFLDISKPYVWHSKQSCNA